MSTPLRPVDPSVPTDPVVIPRKSYAWQIAAVYLFLIVVGLSVLQIWYWMLWPEYPLELKSPIKVVEVQQFGASNTIIYEMNYCKDKKYADLPSVVHYMLMNHDGVLHELPGEAMGTLPIGCKTVKIALPIPLLKPGVFTVTMTRVYTINPLRTSVVQSDSGEFVVPSPVTALVQLTNNPATGKATVMVPENAKKPPEK